MDVYIVSWFILHPNWLNHPACVSFGHFQHCPQCAVTSPPWWTIADPCTARVCLSFCRPLCSKIGLWGIATWCYGNAISCQFAANSSCLEKAQDPRYAQQSTASCSCCEGQNPFTPQAAETVWYCECWRAFQWWAGLVLSLWYLIFLGCWIQQAVPAADQQQSEVFLSVPHIVLVFWLSVAGKRLESRVQKQEQQDCTFCQLELESIVFCSQIAVPAYNAWWMINIAALHQQVTKWCADLLTMPTLAGEGSPCCPVQQNLLVCSWISLMF